MYQAIRTTARGRHRERRGASLLDGPAARWAVWGTVAVAVVGLSASIVGQVVVAYGVDPVHGRTVLLVATIGILSIGVAVLATVATGAILQRIRVARVRRQTRDIVYVARMLPEFADGLRCFSGNVSTRSDVYCFSIGSSGIRIWTGLRAPVMVAAIHWSAIESAHLDRAHSRTLGYWSARLVASADASTPLLLSPIEWFSGVGGKRRAAVALRQIRWHLVRRDNY